MCRNCYQDGHRFKKRSQCSEVLRFVELINIMIIAEEYGFQYKAISGSSIKAGIAWKLFCSSYGRFYFSRTACMNKDVSTHNSVHCLLEENIAVHRDQN
jgi:hypothetical protein